MGAAPQVRPEDRVAEFREVFTRVEAEVGRVIVGHKGVIRKVLTALFCGGHVLIEGVPGLGKTLMVKTAAEALGLSFKRVQFTPDLMPSDITGTQFLNEVDGHRQFEFKPGPIFVLATQNPIELEGTYPLPEAQMDRFMFKVVIGPPKPEELREILIRTTTASVYQPKAVLDPQKAPEAIEQLKLLVREVMTAEPVERYAIGIISSATPSGPGAPPEITQYLRFGPSPRGAQA